MEKYKTIGYFNDVDDIIYLKDTKDADKIIAYMNDTTGCFHNVEGDILLDREELPEGGFFTRDKQYFVTFDIEDDEVLINHLSNAILSPNTNSFIDIYKLCVTE